MTEPLTPVQIQLHLDWSAADGVSVTPVNQFATILGPPTKNGIPDGIFVVLGNIVPPIIHGDNAELKQKSIEAAQRTGVQVTINGRYHFSRDRLNDLIENLQTIVKAYDATASGRPETETKE